MASTERIGSPLGKARIAGRDMTSHEGTEATGKSMWSHGRTKGDI